jgi:hypothetical protein
MLDRRGTGASDGVLNNAIPTWEEWTEDIAAVLDAVGSKQTAILGGTDMGPIAILFAALDPERVRSLILFNTSARFLEADDYPIGVTPQAIETAVDMLATMWGTPDIVRRSNPSMADDPELVRFCSTLLRSSSTPRSAAAQTNYMLRGVDVRQALPLIQAPTLVLHVRDNPFMPISHGRYLADHIDRATFVELPGADIVPSPANFITTDEVAEFLTGERPVVERVLTSVLFTDMVHSTEIAAELGDKRWRSILDAHYKMVRDQLRRASGREINTTGDGFVASFDGPARAIRCAGEIIDAAKRLGIEIRAGRHNGECEVRGEDLGGMAVHIAARVASLAGSSEVLVSGTVKDLVVGSGIGSWTARSKCLKACLEPGDCLPPRSPDFILLHKRLIRRVSTTRSQLTLDWQCHGHVADTITMARSDPVEGRGIWTDDGVARFRLILVSAGRALVLSISAV